MRDLSENMRSPGFRLYGLGAAALLILALALSAWGGSLADQWLGVLGLAAGLLALAANWSGLTALLGLGPAGRKDDLREELAEVGKVAHDAADDLAHMEEILEDLVNENRRALAESATTVNQLKNRVLSLDSAERAERNESSHQRLAALEARLQAADEAIASLRALADRRLPAPESALAEAPSRSEASASFLADVAASSSARRRSETTAEPLLAPEGPRPAAARSGGASMGDLAETLRHRAREAQEARRNAAAAARPAPPPQNTPAAQVAQAYADPPPSGGLAASLTPLASLAAMAGGAPSQTQPAAAPQQAQPARRAQAASGSQPQPQPQPQRGGGGAGRAAASGGASGAASGAERAPSGGPAPGDSIPIYALASRTAAGRQLGVAEGAPLAERLGLAAAKAAELAASGAEEGVHLPVRGAHLTAAAAAEIEAALRANPDLARRLVLAVPVSDLEALAVEPLDALRAHGAALRVDVPSPDGLNAEHFSRLKVELAAAPGLLALAMAPHAMQMGMALMASDVAEPVMLQALSIAGIPLVSGPATDLLAQAGPAPQA